MRAIAGALPLESLLVETDCPYLAPVPCRGKRNEPALLTHTLLALAAARNQDPGVLARAIEANVDRVFRRMG